MKKKFLFSMLAVLLAGFWFGGASLADDVAKIGDTPYTSLGAAFDAAGDGGTITLLSDLTRSSSTINITDKTLTLDLNGHVINTSKEPLFKVNGGNLTVTGTSATEGGVNSTVGGIFYVFSGNLVINGGTFTGKSTLYVHGETARATVNDGYFVGREDGNTTSIGVNWGGELVINSGTFIAGVGDSPDNKPQKVIYAGDDYNKCGKADSGYEIRGGTITIKGGYFEGRLSRSNEGTYNIEGGTFNVKQDKTAGVGCDYNVCDKGKADPSSCKDISGMVAMLNSGYIAEGEAGLYTVKPGTTVAVTFNTNDKTRNSIVYIKKDATISKPAATKYSSEEAGEFDWYDENGVFDFNTPITSDITLYGKWKHTVSFDKNGGVGIIENQEIRDGGKVNKPANPENTGNIFVGWFNGENEFDFDVALTNTNDLEITLTGQWEAITSTGGALIEDDSTGTGMVVEADAPTTPTTDASAVQSSDSTATVQGEIELDVYHDADGNGVKEGDKIDTRVNFTQTVPVRIPVSSGSTAKIKVKHNGAGEGFGIDGLATASGSCTSGVANANVYDGGDVAVTSGYVEIWTCSASTFVAYTEVANPAQTPSGSSSGSSGGGGGGSSSYSCKNLPANAVANNTSKPKKNTDYSYSTDTSAVCTFQCKSGYTRNEKDAKCEKSDTEATTGDTAKLDETKTDENKADNNEGNKDATAVNGYSQEFIDAYEFAFKNGITTMPSIQEADMEGTLTRIAMAKMLSQYAINVLGKKPANIVVPNFPDVSAELDEQYNNGVALAYQLGIMGINIENFRPNDLVTRAEFGTALSRLLYGTADGEGAYYETHLQKLMDEKIITNDNPDLQELRGYVMIMLMRSANK